MQKRAFLVTLTLLFAASLAIDTKRPKLGGYIEIDTNRPDVIAAADFATIEINARSNSLHKAVRTKIIAAFSQVAAGINYKLTMELNRAGNNELQNVIVFKGLSGQYKLVEHNGVRL